jgi:DNA invertase Pin-like site-specific DNA recombinase
VNAAFGSDAVWKSPPPEHYTEIPFKTVNQEGQNSLLAEDEFSYTENGIIKYDLSCHTADGSAIVPQDPGSKAHKNSLPQSSISRFLAGSRHSAFELIGRKLGDVTLALIGYARTSTLHQDAGLDAQLHQLEALGCKKVFREQVSSIADRARLTAALEYVREGDTFVVTKLDRLARSVAHLVEITAELKRKGVALKIIDMGVDTSTPTGRLFLNIVGSIAQFEREIMLERQREGVAAAKAAGRYKGRAPTARRKADEIQKLAAEGVNKSEIARRLGIGERSVYRMLAVSS